MDTENDKEFVTLGNGVKLERLEDRDGNISYLWLTPFGKEITITPRRGLWYIDSVGGRKIPEFAGGFVNIYQVGALLYNYAETRKTKQDKKHLEYIKRKDRLAQEEKSKDAPSTTDKID